MNDVEERTIVGAGDQERIAVITVAIPAGGELPMDRTFRFEGWLIASKAGRYRRGRGTRVKFVCERPATIYVEPDE
jgi:hypothetical protein